MAIAAGAALGALLTPVSGGSSLAVALSIAGVSTAVISSGLAVAQQFVEESAPKTAAALGWAALGTGTVSGISSAALSGVAPGANSLVSLLKGTSNRPFGGLMMEGGAVQQRAGASGDTLAIDIFTSNERNLLNKGGIKTQRFNGPLYRSDNRPPETIFEQGFQAKGLNGNYNDHFMNSARTGKSHFISFTDDIECAKKFAKPKQCFPPFSSYFPKGPHHSYIYEVDHLDYALDLKHLNSTENEIAAVSSVPTHHIKGAHTYLSINQIPRPQGFITNPNYIL
ncbi:hypothetical protein [Serratia sp. M24T3]|uniref:scabin-related ADP-ribosyltransferase n=1 Tax=Serratia sp. M24T3 TaxID=932213 RepID=UPI001ED97CDF|nr:hypothetical protein [Serratia sp. M24T3]